MDWEREGAIRGGSCKNLIVLIGMVSPKLSTALGLKGPRVWTSEGPICNRIWTSKGPTCNTKNSGQIEFLMNLKN